MRRMNELRYTELFHVLKEHILSGAIRPGDFLLSENKLASHYGISRTSVRTSLDLLRKEGLIVKLPSRGSIVNPDLVIPASEFKTLNILATSPSEFCNFCLPIIQHCFEQTHPNVKVHVMHYHGASFWDHMDSGLEPDLLIVHDRHFANLEEDQFALFQEIPSAIMDSSSFYPKLLTAFAHDGQYRAVPATFSTIFLAYNPKLFQEYHLPEPNESWTLDDLLDAAQIITRDENNDGVVDLYGISLSEQFSRWLVFALQNGVDFFSPAKRNKTALRDTLNTLHDLLYRKKVATLFKSRNFRINSDAFPKQRAAMVLTTSMELAGWRNIMDFEPKVVPMPFGPVQATTAMANLFMMPAASENHELAQLFIRTALDEEVQQKVSQNTHFMSVLKEVNPKVWQEDYLHSLYITKEDIENSYFLHELFPSPQLLKKLEESMEWFWAGLESADSFASKLAQMIADGQHT